MPISRSRAVPVATRRGPLVLVASDAADAGAGHGLVEGEPLAALADDLLDVGEPGAGLGRDDQVAGGVVEHLVERADVEQHVGARWAAVPQVSLVPRPRGTTVSPCAAAARSTSATCVGVGRPGHHAGRRRRRRASAVCGVVDVGAGRGDRPRARCASRVSGAHQKTSARPASCSGWAPLCRPGTSPHSRGVGKTLPGLEMLCGVEGAADQLHGVEVLVGVHPRHVLRLVHADAVLAGDRAAVLDAQVEDRAADLLGRLAGALDGVVEEHQRVQVAVAGVEDVGDPDARGRRRARRSP